VRRALHRCQLEADADGAEIVGGRLRERRIDQVGGDAAAVEAVRVPGLG